MAVVKFTARKPETCSSEEFQSALACAKGSVESVLYDSGLLVELENNSIVVSSEEGSDFSQNAIRELKLRTV